MGFYNQKKYYVVTNNLNVVDKFKYYHCALEFKRLNSKIMLESLKVLSEKEMADALKKKEEQVAEDE